MILATTPKDILKHGLVEFIQTMTKPVEENICYSFFVNIFENVLDAGMGLGEALERAFQMDFTHMGALDESCREGQTAVASKWSRYAPQETKVVHNFLHRRVSKRSF